MKRIFRTRTFSRWARKVGLPDSALSHAVSEMERGLIDADLGGNVVKKRVPLAGRGKRGGARTLVATQFDDRWFFLYGFAKNERANLTANELRVLQEVAKDVLAFNDTDLAMAVNTGELVEIDHDEENRS